MFTRAILLALLLWPVPAWAIWTPPIGVPTPVFGINDTAPATPSPWTTPTAGFYYINEATGNDTSNPFGTPAAPRQTIPEPIPAGSVVEIHGTYTQVKTFPHNVQLNGTISQPIFFRGVDSNTKPVFHNYIEFRGSYFIVENIDFAFTNSGAGRYQIGVYDSDHGAIRACDIHGTIDGGAMSVQGFVVGSVPVTQFVVYNNFIHENGDYALDSPIDQDVHGISLGAHVDHFWIVDNEMTHNSGDGTQIGAGEANRTTLHHIYVGRNVSHANKQTGMWVKQATDVIFSQNTSYGHRNSGSAPGGGMGGQYSPTRFWLLYNTIYDNNRGIHIASSQTSGGAEVYLIGNLIYDHVNDTENIGMSIWDFSSAYIVNNTFVGNKFGQIEAPLGGTVGLLMYNNILTGRVDTGSSSLDVYLSSAGSAAASQFQNNLVFQSSGERIQWAGGTETLAAFQSRTGKGQNSVNTNPLFVDAAAKNFRLTASSPARDAGLVSSVYATFQALYGLSIAKDIMGATRPINGVWDMGAYEYSASAPSLPPPPTLLRVGP